MNGASLALCTVVEAQLRLEPMVAKLETFRKEFSLLSESREFNADLNQMENDIYAGVYSNSAELQKALDSLKIKIEPLDKAVRQYHELLSSFKDEIFIIIRRDNCLDATKDLNKIIEYLGDAPLRPRLRSSLMGLQLIAPIKLIAPKSLNRRR